MAFDLRVIDGIMNTLGGPAQPCHYQVVIIPPAGMLSGGLMGLAGGALSIGGAFNLGMLAEQAELPGRQLATTPFTMYGTTRKMPYAAVYDDLNITFICSNAMVERAFFDVWMSFIMNPQRQYMHYYDDYTTTITIVKLAPDLGTSVASGLAANYTFLEAYPYAIQAQPLSYASDDYLRLTVSFAYRRWTTLAEVAASYFNATPKGVSLDDATNILNQRSQGELDSLRSNINNLSKSFT